eukprot:2092639-Pleurochrysis_carterae.AAC.1
MVANIPVHLKTKTYVVLDVSTLRHSEHLSNSGWCGCTLDQVLRLVPTMPATIADMHTALKGCHSPTALD